MANLVSPGVSVTVTDQSFFIPASAPTVPLIFVATADHKLQPDGLTPAAGTYEHDVIRSVTSVAQSLTLYGIPRFLADTQGNQFHGDARNEYGLFALNQFLGIGNNAYVIRANVNLDDDITDVRTLWANEVASAASTLDVLIDNYITEYNTTNGYIPGSASNGSQTVNFAGSLIGTNPASVPAGTSDFYVSVNGAAPQHIVLTITGTETIANLLSMINGIITGATASLSAGNIVFTSSATGPVSSIALTNGIISNLFTAMPGFVAVLAGVPGVNLYKVTVNAAELISLAEQAMVPVFELFSFRNMSSTFFKDPNDLPVTVPLNIYANGYTVPPTGTYLGFDGMVHAWATALTPSTSSPSVAGEFGIADGGNLLTAAADEYQHTQPFLNLSSLGANDSARRASITTALQASVGPGNSEIRSENYEYNLILCPGYPELVDEMLALVSDIQDEALVVADTPMNLSPEDTVTWGGTSNRQHSDNVAYYYPPCLAPNIDGVDVLATASGTALRTYAYSDNVSQLWFAPAGTNRGLITGITDLGVASGTLGGPTTFVETHVNLGQRNSLYQYTTNINPLAFFTGQGFVVWGQKTSAPAASAMDRVNVSRLVKYIKRSLRKNTMPFIFEPNDQLTRDNLKAVVDAFLGNLIVNRGLYDFATVCDGTNNTPSVIAQNELFIDVAIKPVIAAEFLYIPIRILATGAPI